MKEHRTEICALYSSDNYAPLPDRVKELCSF